MIEGHPRPGSLSDALAEAYRRGARRAGAELRSLRLRELDFARDVTAVPIAAQRQEPDVERARRDIAWAQHLVFVFPTWWGGMPALAKAFIDRVFMPGFAFEETEESISGFRGLLGGRTAQIVTTMDTPAAIYRLAYGRPGHNALGKAILGFCGVAPTRISSFGPVRSATQAERQAWLRRVEADAAALRGVGIGPARAVWRRAVPWLQALRLQFYPMTWAAYAVGALLAGGPAATGQARFWAGYLVLFLLEAATVFVNEVVDEPSDRQNRHFGPFSGGSRVLVGGGLTRRLLLQAALACGAGAALLTVLLLLPAPDPPALGAAAAALAVLAIGYTAPPLKLSWRGLGELDVAVTHSIGVLLFGFLLYGGSWGDPVPWLVSLPLGLSILPAIVLAGLPDRPADAEAGKRTLAVLTGPSAAMAVAILALLVSAALPALYARQGLAQGLYDPLTVAAPLHAALLAALMLRRILRREVEGRMNGLLALALSYILWFALSPLILLW